MVPFSPGKKTSFSFFLVITPHAPQAIKKQKTKAMRCNWDRCLRDGVSLDARSAVSGSGSQVQIRERTRK
jgi:hypothetical protein